MTPSGKGTRYPGARSFHDTALDRKLFQGREQEKDALLHLILAEPLVVLYGRSGVGKTSLLNAGVLENLRGEGFFPLHVRVNEPDRGPLETIYDGVSENARRAGVEYVPGDETSLWSFFKTLELWKEDTLLTPVLLVDQFEELFTLQSPEARHDFIEALSTLVRGPGPEEREIRGQDGLPLSAAPPSIKIVISIREDFLGDLEELAPKIPHILHTRFRVKPLGPQQARAAIETPASVVDERIETDSFSYAEGTVDAIVSFLSRQRREAGSSVEIEPFQLQLICQNVEAMVRQRRDRPVVVELDDLGGEDGLRNMLEQFYDKQIASLAARFRRRRLTKLCERGLINPQGRRLSLEQDEIRNRYRVEPTALQELVDSRLLRAEPRVGSTYYELSHDTLVEPILESRRKRRKRNRRRTTALATLAGVFLIGSAVLRLYTGEGSELIVSPETTYFVEPLREDGTVNYAAALNARFGVGVTAENNAAVLLVPILARDEFPEFVLRLGLPSSTEPTPFIARSDGRLIELLEESAPDLVTEDFRSQLDEEFNRCSTSPWSDGDCPRVAAWLRVNERALSRIIEATDRPHFWIPLNEDKEPYAQEILDVGRVLGAGEALRARSLKKLGSIEFEAAASDLIAAMRLRNLVSRGPSLFECVLGIGEQKRAVQVVPVLANNPPPRLEVVERIRHDLMSESPSNCVSDTLDIKDRAALLSQLTTVYRHQEDGNLGEVLDAVPPALPLVGNVPLDWNEIFRQVNRNYDAITARSREASPDSTWAFAYSPFDMVGALWSPRSEWTSLFLREIGLMYMPDPYRLRAVENELQAQFRMAVLSLALSSYHAERNQYPLNLTTLAEDLGDPALDLTADHGYRFQYSPLVSSGDRPDAFAITAKPIEAGTDAFCVGPEGPIRSYRNVDLVAGAECPPP